MTTHEYIVIHDASLCVRFWFNLCCHCRSHKMLHLIMVLRDLRRSDNLWGSGWIQFASRRYCVGPTRLLCWQDLHSLSKLSSEVYTKDAHYIIGDVSFLNFATLFVSFAFLFISWSSWNSSGELKEINLQMLMFTQILLRSYFYNHRSFITNCSM